MPTKLTALTVIGAPGPAYLLYIVDPAAGLSGSKAIAANDLMQYPTKSIADKGVRLEGTGTAPGSLISGQGVFYFDTGSNSFKISENGGAFRDVVLVGKTGQVLTSVTINSSTLNIPTIGNFSSANHNHSSAATGGAITDVPTVLTDAPAGTVTPDAALGLNNFFRCTFNAGSNARTFNGPANPVDAQTVIFELKQNASGPNTVTWQTGAGNYAFGADITSATLSITANATDYVTCVYNLAANRWRIVGFVKGY